MEGCQLFGAAAVVWKFGVRSVRSWVRFEECFARASTRSSPFFLACFFPLFKGQLPLLLKGGESLNESMGINKSGCAEVRFVH